MRITGGQKKGCRLAPFKGLDIRPTSDKVREAIFNFLNQDMEGLHILDLFAGTGSFGIEALSRGADHAVFIDNSVKSINLIKKNLEKCGYLKTALVIKKDLSRGLPVRPDFAQKKFDLVFIDPPYGRGLIPPLLKELAMGKIVRKTGMIITESQKYEILPDKQNGLTCGDSRRYGETKIDRYIYGENK